MLREPLFFTIGDRRFQARRLCAADEFQCVRRLGPCVAGFSALLTALTGFGRSVKAGGQSSALADAIELTKPLADALAELKDEDVDVVLAHCLGVAMMCEADGAWTPLWDRQAQGPRDHDLGVVEAIRVCHAVLAEALSAFYAPRRLEYRQTSPQGASYEPVRLPDDLDYLYAPTYADPPLIPFAHLFDGTIGLAHVVRANEALEARSENVRRAQAAAATAQRDARGR